jgi:pilus assembly protein CpaF
METPAPIPLMTQLPVRDPYKDEKFKLLQRVMNELDPNLDLTNEAEVRRAIEATFKRVLEEEGLPLTRGERARLLEQIVDEIIGYGPIEPMLRDDTVTEVMVNGPHSIYVERAGKLEMTNVEFRDNDHVLRIIDRIIRHSAADSTSRAQWSTRACLTAAASTP